MQLIKTYLILFTLLLFCNNVKAQEDIFSKADSLKTIKINASYLIELKNINRKLTKSDNKEALLKVNRKIFEYYKLYEINSDSIEKYYSIGSNLATYYNNAEYKANFSFMWADYQVSSGNYKQALEFFQSLEKEIEDNNYHFLPHFYDSYARLFFYLKKYEQAFELLKKEAKIFEQRINEVEPIEKRRVKVNTSSVYNNLGILYTAQKEIDSALYYHKKAQEINFNIKDTLGIIKSYNNIGKTYFDVNDFVNAEKNYLKAYNFDPNKTTNSLLNNYAGLLSFQGENKKAEAFLLKVKQQSENKELLKTALTQLIKLKKNERAFEQALLYQEELNIVSQNMLDETKVKEIERLQIGFETAKKEQEIEILQEKNKTQQLIIQKNKWLVSIALLLLLLAVIILILFSRNKTNRGKINQLRMQQRLLRSQMNPHFIFNALSNIQTNILKQENEKAVKYLVKFSKLLRYSLEQTNFNSALFSKEIQVTTDYLDMQNLRLDGALQYQLNIDASIEQDSIKIPAMMLQPIIENAIEHGIETVKNPTIEIRITDKEKYLQCVITDNGLGYSNTLQTKSTSKKSFSTTIINQRLLHLSKKTNLNLTYSIADLLEQENTIVGTKSIILLPILNNYQAI